MSRRLISLNPDLRRLADEGYDISVEEGYLVVRDVPFVDVARRIRRGTIISALDLAGDRTVAPSDHTVWFSGGHPCDVTGRGLGEMAHGYNRRDLGSGLVAEYLLCSRPLDGEYRDFHQKISTFVAQVASHAEVLDSTVTARTGRVVTATGGRSVFAYVDTASARHGIGALNARLSGHSVGIVGLGGTGGYIVDLVAKTPVHRIHLFDDDRVMQHNAFRMPGAASLDELRQRPSKAAYFESVYSRMHNGIIAHEARLDQANLDMLDHLDFVFLAVDSASSRRILVAELERRSIDFVDCGIGMHLGEAGMSGSVRITTSTCAMRVLNRSHPRIPMQDILDEDPYGSAAQTADMNCLAAALAVMRWKKVCGFYLDLEREHHMVFDIDGNHILNEDCIGPDRG